MSSNFQDAFVIVVGEEGGYTDDPRDTGNWTGGKRGEGELRGTKFGISARQYPTLDIRNLSLEQAFSIYYSDYWMPIKGEDLPRAWAICAFDCAVNQGVDVAILLMQDALGVTPDLNIGTRTLQAAIKADDRHLARFMMKRALRYMRHPNFDTWKAGWFTRLFVVTLGAAGHGR